MRKPPFWLQVVMLAVWGTAVFWWRPFPWAGFVDGFFVVATLAAPAVFWVSPRERLWPHLDAALEALLAAAFFSTLGGGVLWLLITEMF